MTLAATSHPARFPVERASRASDQDGACTLLERERLPDHIDVLYRAAYALSGSQHDAEDLVQETFAQVLNCPRFVRRDHELRYLMRALHNTHRSRSRTVRRRPQTVPLPDNLSQPAPEAAFAAREIMQAIASAAPVYRDAVVAIDILGMSYQEAAKSLRTREVTLATRLHRGRHQVAQALLALDA